MMMQQQQQLQLVDSSPRKKRGKSTELSASLRGDHRTALRSPSNNIKPGAAAAATIDDKTKPTAAERSSNSNAAFKNIDSTRQPSTTLAATATASASQTTSSITTTNHHHHSAAHHRNNAALILSNTHLVLNDLQNRSSFFRTNPQRALPSFEPHEVQVGAILGTGEFGVVLEIIKLHLPPEQQSPEGCCPPGSEHDALMAQLKGQSLNANGSVLSQSSLPTSILVPASKTSDNPTAPHKRMASKTFVELEASLTAEAQDQDDGIEKAMGPAPIPNHSQHTQDDEDAVIAALETNDDHDSLDSAITSSTKTQQQVAVAAVLEKTRQCLSEHVHRDGMARYALKRLRLPSTTSRSSRGDSQQQQKYRDQHVMNAAIDLACEATFLASLSHSNIVRLRATVGTVGHVNFCIVMDRLTDTLEDRMVSWVARSQACRRRPSGLLGLMSKRSRDKQQAWQQLYADRLLAAFDIARAIRYLHANKIIYRDIKPDNVGFDVRGNVRIFDFGLAKELKKHDLVEAPDKYDATGLTGSRRYMSVECIKCLPYGFSADVYSYSILFWQIFSLQMPFPNLDVRKHYEQVVVKHKRPNKQAVKVSPMLLNMMTSGWDDDPAKRPSFKQICQQLQVEIMDVTADGAGGASIIDRSTHLMNRSLNSLYNNVVVQDDDDDF